MLSLTPIQLKPYQSQNFFNPKAFVQEALDFNSSKLETIFQTMLLFSKSFYYMGTGIKELISPEDGIQTITFGEQKSEKQKKIKKISKNFFHKLKESEAEQKHYHKLHGLLLVGSGFSIGLSGLSQMGALPLGQATKGITFIANGLFILSNLVLLEREVKIYYHSFQLLKSATHGEYKIYKFLNISSLTGILSCLANILATALIMLGGWAAIAFVLAGVAALCNCFKFLYEYILLTTNGLEYSSI